jgi:hypothetical protein
MPAEFHCSFPFTSIGSLTANGLGTAVTTIYRVNSLYDPVYAAGGGQPLQFALVRGVYAQYRVLSACVQLRFFDPDADGLCVGFRVRPDTDSIATAGASLDYLSEMLWTKTKSIANTGEQCAEFSADIPMHTVFGIPSVQLRTDDTFGAAYNANPVRAALLDVFAVDPATGTGNVKFQISISYRCIMSGRVTQAQ